ncbi:MAG: hydroxyacylglutathione hydrolase [Betaproteobacteria bacterium HGW-Betaproteobacteria-22]|nr:MAG: hydroxyacylglutathione hydrolase [Betaproteobacteria bacterium HGW-Betaproteobacteria-22]
MIEHMQDKIQIIPIPAFTDNYIWLIHNGQSAIVVDPGDALPVLNTLKALNLDLKAILITHHHQDHIGGVGTLLEKNPHISIYGSAQEHYSFQHIAVSDCDQITVADWLNVISVIGIPGHTLGHVAFYLVQDKAHHLFCGDTLFGAGCGRLFEGTPAQMLTSLKKLASLPGNTMIFCAHEYTLHNINFALTIEPNNQALIQRRQDTALLISKLKPSLPSTIDLERATNPFLRYKTDEIKTVLQLKNAGDLEVFTKIRLMRNSY